MEKQDKIALGIFGSSAVLALLVGKSNKSLVLSNFRNADGSANVSYTELAKNTQLVKNAKANVDALVAKKAKLESFLSEFDSKKNALANLGVNFASDPNSGKVGGRGGNSNTPGISQYVFDAIFEYPHPYPSDNSMGNGTSIWNIDVNPNGLLSYKGYFKTGNIRLDALRTKIWAFFNNAGTEINDDILATNTQINNAQKSYDAILKKEAKRLEDEAKISAAIKATTDTSTAALLEAEAKKIEEQRISDSQKLAYEADQEKVKSDEKIKMVAIIGGAVLLLGGFILLRK